jgi:carbon-monoxide dehydrogenase large subunit
VNTVLSQIAAETLSMPVEMVHYSPRVDTDFSPHEWQTVASHTTWAVGNAVRMAAQDVLEQLKHAAAQVLEVSAENLETREPRFKGLLRASPRQPPPVTSAQRGGGQPTHRRTGLIRPEGINFPRPRNRPGQPGCQLDLWLPGG